MTEHKRERLILRDPGIGEAERRPSEVVELEETGKATSIGSKGSTKHSPPLPQGPGKGRHSMEEGGCPWWRRGPLVEEASEQTQPNVFQSNVHSVEIVFGREFRSAITFTDPLRCFGMRDGVILAELQNLCGEEHERI